MFWTVTLNATVDHIYSLPTGGRDKALLAQSAVHVPAGKGINVSRALACLGTFSTAVVLVSPDEEARFHTSLSRSGIVSRLIPELERTRQHVTLLPADGSPPLHVRERGEATGEDARLQIHEALSEVAAGDIVALCGSLPPGLPSPLYHDLIEELAGRGALVWLDSSGPPLVQALRGTAMPYGLKLNRQEAAEVLGAGLIDLNQAGAAVRELLGQGIEIVCVTLGAEGLILGTAEGLCLARPEPAPALNPVGSGDAALAGLMLSQARGTGLQAAARLATAAAAATTRTLVPGFFTEDGFHEAMAGVIVSEIA